MKLKSAFLTLSVFGILCLSTSCMRKSALSDVEVNDPSILKLDVLISQSATDSIIYENDTVSNEITVKLFDLHNDLVQLKNGYVTVNDMQMDLWELQITGGIEYGLDGSQIDIKPNTLYTVVVHLPNGKSYSSSIRTQNYKIRNCRIPKKIIPNRDIPVTWNGFEIGEDEAIEIHYSSSVGQDSLAEYDSQYFKIDNGDCKRGKFNIPSSYNHANKPFFSGDIELTSRKDKYIESDFASGSIIRSEISVKRSFKN